MNIRKTLPGLVFLLAAGWLQAKPVITSVTLDATTVTILFDEDGSSNQFELQANPSLNPATWSNAPSAVRTNLGAGKFRYTIARTAADRQFFRIIGSFLGTGVDRDGDGLPNDLETGTTGSNPDRFDTDGDGFSDGVEFSLGTNPTLPGSRPELANLPAVNFVSANSVFMEGSAPVHRLQLSLSQAFTGPVTYTVNAASTLAAPADFTALSGTVMVNGTTATIDITFTDDFVIKPSRYLVVQLTPRPASAGYRVGGGETHVCVLTENDAYWTGAIQDGRMVRDFRMRILKKTGQPSQVAFVAGAADGRTLVDAGASSQSTGVIPQTPQNIWPAEGVADTAVLFTALTPLLPVPVSALPGFGNTSSAITMEPLTRRLSLTANNALAPNQTVLPNLVIQGSFTETTAAADPVKTYLTRTRSGTFTLARDVPVPPTAPFPLSPTP